MDSGDPETLISFCKMCTQQFPAKKYSLILSNHGTGSLDPFRTRFICPSELFKYNPSNNLFELNRCGTFLHESKREYVCIRFN